jgi:hypothetical protein
MKAEPLKPSVDLTAPDEATEMEMHIWDQLGGQVREFRLVVVDEGLILRGRARTYYAKQLAQQAAIEATELPIVANDIEVN